jgi:hypothetical protein
VPITSRLIKWNTILSRNRAMPDISPSDRDMMIRTVIGEADDQPPVGQAAIAHVILNRMATGQWGNTPSQVVLSRGQFEPWSTRARELIGIKPTSDQYKKVGSVVDDVLAGKTPDPTGGMTHFLQPDIVRRRRGGSLPDWASGPGLRIGDHLFYAPEGKVAGGPEEDLVSEWLPKGAPVQAARPSQAVPAQEEDLLSEWLPKGTPAAKPVAAPIATATTPVAPTPPDSHETLPQLINRLTAEAHGHGQKNLSDLVTGRAPDSISDAAIRAAIGVGRGVGTVADTLGQGIAWMGEKGAHELASLGVIAPERARAVSDWRKGVLSSMEANRAGYEAAGPGLAGRIGEVGGEVAGTAPFITAGGAALGAVPGVGQAMNLISKAPFVGPALGPLARGAATGAAANALTSSASDIPVLEQARAGAELGAPLGLAGHALGRILGAGVDRETAKLAETARDKFGINVRASQISSNPTVRFMDSVLQRLPFTGMGSHSAEQQLSLQRALANEMGVSADKITPDVVKRAQQVAYSAYDTAKANMGPLKLDRQFYGDLSNVLTNASYNLEEGPAKLVNGHLRNVVDKINQATQTLDPDLYQSLTRKNGPLDKAINSRDSKIASYAGDIKDALESLVGRNDPQLKALKDAADYKYFVAKAVEPLADEATTGNISPAKLLKAVDYSHTNAGELGRIARRFMVEPPSSGTAERTFVLQHLPQLASGALGVGALSGATYFDPESWQRNALIGAGALAAGVGGGSILRGRALANAMIRSGLRSGQSRGGALSLLPALAPRTTPWDSRSASP